jgi:hypothetical protein
MTRAAVITDTPPETLAQRNPSVIRSLIDQLWSHCLQIQEREEPHQSKQQIPTNSLLSGEELLLPAVITLLHAEAIARSPRGAVDKTSSHSARGEEYPIKNHITSQLEQIIDPSEPIPHSRYVSTGLSTEGKHIFVIPDIHGNYDLLRESLDYIGQQLHAQEIDPNGAVLVQLGDLINKGPDSGAVLGLMDALKRAASVSSSSPGEAAQKTSNFNHLVDELGLAGFGEVALLIGNHEDAGNIGMHLTSDAPIDDYARDTSHALHRYGLRETILSIITDFPDAFENEDARWLAAAVDSFPVRIGKEDGWYWSKDGSEQAEGVPTQRDVEDFFQTFRNIWVPGLEESGLLGVAASLKPAHRVGDFIFTHAGPPKDAHQMSYITLHRTATLPSRNTRWTTSSMIIRFLTKSFFITSPQLFRRNRNRLCFLPASFLVTPREGVSSMINRPLPSSRSGSTLALAPQGLLFRYSTSILKEKRQCSSRCAVTTASCQLPSIPLRSFLPPDIAVYPLAPLSETLHKPLHPSDRLSAHVVLSPL